jgi:hypothetical protein
MAQSTRLFAAGANYVILRMCRSPWVRIMKPCPENNGLATERNIVGVMNS